MDDIRLWIAAHPSEEASLLAANPRYVFFRTLDGPPLGSLGVPVTAGRTIATDAAVFPPGALAFVRRPGHGDQSGTHPSRAESGCRGRDPRPGTRRRVFRPGRRRGSHRRPAALAGQPLFSRAADADGALTAHKRGCCAPMKLQQFAAFASVVHA